MPLVPPVSIVLLGGTWYADEERHSHTIIKRRFTMDSRVKIFDKLWPLTNVSFKIK